MTYQDAAGDSTNAFWNDVIVTWEREHPQAIVSPSTGTGVGFPPQLDVQLFATFQVIGDAFHFSDFGAPRVAEAKEVDLAATVQESTHDGGNGAFDTAADAPEGSAWRINGNIDWNAFISDRESRYVDPGIAESFTDDALKSVGNGESATIRRIKIPLIYVDVRHSSEAADPDLSPSRALLIETPQFKDGILLDSRHGSNVLYDDGHVEFLEFDSSAGAPGLLKPSAKWTLVLLQHHQEYLASQPTGESIIDSQCP